MQRFGNGIVQFSISIFPGKEPKVTESFWLDAEISGRLDSKYEDLYLSCN